MAYKSPESIFHTIYKITNLINSKFYIGKHSTNNLDDGYYGSGKAIKSAIKKYGKENFKKEILFIFNTEKEALNKEKELVDENTISLNNCYNSVVGGDGSWHHVKNLIPCIDDCGEIYLLNKEDFDPKIHKGVCKGKLIVYDTNGVSYRIDKDDPRLSTGELVPFSKGRVTVKDKDGNTSSVLKNDPRYLSGELVYYRKGTKSKYKENWNKESRSGKNSPRAQKVFVNGVMYDTLTMASNETGISYHKIRKIYLANKSCNIKP